MTESPSLLLPQPPFVIVDTDVISYVFKADSRGRAYERHLIGKILVMSAHSRAELYAWPIRRGWGPRRTAELEAVLRRFVVFYPDEGACRVYGEMTAKASNRGLSIPPDDAWHAATAIRLRAPLVTHNARHYRAVPDLVLITEPAA